MECFGVKGPVGIDKGRHCNNAPARENNTENRELDVNLFVSNLVV